MSFKFKKANCVALGTFNIYVIQPSFLIDIGLLKNGEAAFHAGLTEPGFRTVATDGSCVWMVKPDRLVVETNDPTRNCGNDVAKILDALEWTPVTAIGSNAEFISENCTYDNFPRVPEHVDGEALQASVHHAIGIDGKIINIQLSRRPKEFELSFNFHCEIKATETKHKKGQLAKNELARRFASEFMTQRDQACSLIHSFFALEVNYEQNSNDSDCVRDVVDVSA